MRAYRTVWDVAVTTLVAVGLLAGGSELGWLPLLAAIAALALLGATMAAAWVQDPWERPRQIGGLALWFGLGAALFLGLPPLTGRWTLLVLAAVGLLSPPVVERIAARGHGARPVPQVHTERDARRLCDRDLERRWRSTQHELRARRGDVAAELALAAERALLLDEVERRDPVGFDDVLVRTGWREPQDH